MWSRHLSKLKMPSDVWYPQDRGVSGIRMRLEYQGGCADDGGLGSGVMGNVLRIKMAHPVKASASGRCHSFHPFILVSFLAKGTRTTTRITFMFTTITTPMCFVSLQSCTIRGRSGPSIRLASIRSVTIVLLHAHC